MSDEADTYLDAERKRFVRRSGQSKAFQSENIFPLVDWVVKRYDADRNKRFSGLNLGYWPLYSNSLEYILSYFPRHEVHSHVASFDRKFMTNFYVSLDRLVDQIRHKPSGQITNKDKRILKYYIKVRDFIPLVRAQMVICG